MDAWPPPPAGIANVPKWQEDCRKIHARAVDVVEGRLDVVAAAVELSRLASWTGVESDPDIGVFRTLLNELVPYPIGSERTRWSAPALAREDAQSRPIIERWTPKAVAAARNLVTRYSWAIEARRIRRGSGHAVRAPRAAADGRSTRAPGDTALSLVRWDEPPAMEAGAPMPAIRRIAESLYVAYVCRNPAFPGWDGGATIGHPGFDVYSAVLRFDGVVDYRFGPPGDERLGEHPLYGYGLEPYEFFELLESSTGPGTGRRWLVTFHDQTLDVVAASASVAHRRIEGEDTVGALAAIADDRSEQP
jgi:hypothetical protein